MPKDPSPSDIDKEFERLVQSVQKDEPEASEKASSKTPVEKAPVARPAKRVPPKDEDDEDEDDEDEDEDDEDEDEDDEDEKPPPRRRARAPERAKPSASARPRNRPARRPQTRLPSEKVINSPKPQTLFMLGVVTFITLVSWGAARFACNAHPPHSFPPRHVSLETLARDPKNAAIEMQQRWATDRFAGALKLASGAALAAVVRDQKTCESNRARCGAERKQLAHGVFTTAELITREPSNATVHVTTSGLPGGSKSYLMQLSRKGAMWKVVSRSAPGAAIPTAPATAPLAPAASGSAP